MRNLILILLLMMPVFTQAGDWGEDKKMHVKASVAVTAVLYSINEYNDRSHWETLGECLVVGALKEVYDEYDYGGADWKGDFAKADVFGCTMGLLLIDTGFKFAASSTSVGIQYKWEFN